MAMDYFKELQGFADRIRSIEPGNYFTRLYQVTGKQQSPLHTCSLIVCNIGAHMVA